MTTISITAPEAGEDPLGSLLAARIRREREARGWSIAMLAEASGVSRAMISKVERGEASPTAALLGRLSGAFSLTVSALMARAEADAAGQRVARAADQPGWTDPATGHRRRALTPAGADPELVEIELPPGVEVAYPAPAYAFLRGVSVWVMAGRLALREGEGVIELGPGDSLAFDFSARQDRAFINPSATLPVRYLVAVARR